MNLAHLPGMDATAITAAQAESIDPNDVTLQILQASGSQAIEPVSRAATAAIPARDAAEAGNDHTSLVQHHDLR
ncbi:MAG: hypothetical protein CVT80_14380 [Alphaproteobacteria bacterium HGW-Alphaproteobacteria-2]|nr:MAG: hypothetical protein CVT80_14380 [Alphaproteobacteria bacterium HGW-Alphaproteobacteria-2]